MEDLTGISLRTTVVHKTLKILLLGVNLCRRNAVSMIALESAKCFDLQHHFLFWTRPKHSLLEQGVKQRHLHDNGRNTIKGGSRETKGQKSTGGGRRENGVLLEQGVKQRHLHDNGRNTIKGGSRETKGQKSTGGGRRENGVLEAGGCNPPDPPPPKVFDISRKKGVPFPFILVRRVENPLTFGQLFVYIDDPCEHSMICVFCVG